jgi:hypothetical protein
MFCPHHQCWCWLSMWMFQIFTRSLLSWSHILIIQAFLEGFFFYFSIFLFSFFKNIQNKNVNFLQFQDIKANKSTHATFKCINEMIATFQLACLMTKQMYFHMWTPLLHMKVLDQQNITCLKQSFVDIGDN